MSPFTLQHEQHSGEPQVFFHGFLGRPSMWDAVIEKRAAQAPSALLTLPGHGPAPWFPREASFVGVLHEISARWPFASPVTLVGYSMGARLALGLTILYPEKIARAILVSGDPGLRSDAERAQRLAWDEEQAALIEHEGLEAFSERWARLPLFDTQEKLPASVREAQQKERREHTTKGAAWAMRCLGLGRMPSWWEQLSTCKVPLEVVTGALDQKFTRIGEEMSQFATHSVIPRVGHNAALEAPASIVNVIERELSLLMAKPSIFPLLISGEGSEQSEPGEFQEPPTTEKTPGRAPVRLVPE
jgi:2-succinyl-6-hydroxy-2,4-cyclohexadiene-1-carboxylate synthase